jgi:hypothetical protein
MLRDMADLIDDAVTALHHELDQARLSELCAGCECLAYALDASRKELALVGTAHAQAVRADLTTWREETGAERHSCRQCAVCLPIEPYDRLRRLVSAGG